MSIDSLNLHRVIKEVLAATELTQGALHRLQIAADTLAVAEDAKLDGEPERLFPELRKEINAANARHTEAKRGMTAIGMHLDGFPLKPSENF